VDEGATIPPWTGLAARVASEQRAVAIEAGEDSGPLLGTNDLRALVGVPLLMEGRLGGVLCVGARQRRFSEDEVRLLQLLADHAAAAVEHAQLYEQALRSEEHLRLLVERVQDYAIFLIDADGRIASWNAGARRIKGYTAEEIIGRPYATFFTAEDRAAGRPERLLRRARADGRVEDEGWRVRKDGTRFWADAVLTALYDAEGRLRGYAKVTRDLTERRRAEEERQRHAAELERRSAELGEVNAELEAFSFSVSHDLRAPLRTMRGFAEALLEDHAEALDADGREYAQRIADAAERMDRLVQDLLAYSRLSRADLRLRPVSLALAVAEALRGLSAEVKERRARLQVREPLPEVVGHEVTLVQVVGNLISNALKFVAPDVRPRVRIWAEPAAGAGAGWVRLWVADNGIGIAPQHRERIFGVLERLHGAEAYPGTGIGLAIVRRGVHRLGGRVGVESTPGRGSRFWLELPAAGRPAEATPAPASPLAEAPAAPDEPLERR
jgi:PAS domain S-box-containing protein